MVALQSETKTVKEILEQKHGIDFYQRGYKWGERQVEDLLNDLTERFLENYEKGHSQRDVRDYSDYFLGIAILAENSEKIALLAKNTSEHVPDYYIVDGQQRLTTLTLLIISLYHKLSELAPNDDLIRTLKDLVKRKAFGEETLNIIAGDERDTLMTHLLEKKEYDPKTEDAKNLLHNYMQIEDLLYTKVDEEAIPLFAEWLISKVYFVQIKAKASQEVYLIFERINDRGLQLTPLEILKAYVIQNIDEERRRDVGIKWNQCVEDMLRELGRGEDAEFVKAWLRSQYAETMREHKRGAPPRDFERIHSEFHRWIQEKKKDLDLSSPEDFIRFVDHFKAYSQWYVKIRKWATNYEEAKKEGMEALVYNAYLGFTLQYPLILASISPKDDEKTVSYKIRLIATALDIWLYRRIWGGQSVKYNDIQENIFRLMKDIRRKAIADIYERLTYLINDKELPKFSDSMFGLGNGWHVHNVLARIEEYLRDLAEVKEPFSFVVFMQRGRGSNKYEIEHILPLTAFDDDAKVRESFSNKEDFLKYRNYLGNLTLLRKVENIRVSNALYASKLVAYEKATAIITRALHQGCYTDPTLQKLHAQGLIRPFGTFLKEDIEERQRQLAQIAEKIWSLDRLAKIKAEYAA